MKINTKDLADHGHYDGTRIFLPVHMLPSLSNIAAQDVDMTVHLNDTLEVEHEGEAHKHQVTKGERLRHLHRIGDKRLNGDHWRLTLEAVENPPLKEMADRPEDVAGDSVANSDKKKGPKKNSKNETDKQS